MGKLLYLGTSEHRDYNQDDSLFLLLQAIYTSAVKDITNSKTRCPYCNVTPNEEHKVNTCAINFILSLKKETIDLKEITGLDIAIFATEVWNGDYR